MTIGKKIFFLVGILFLGIITSLFVRSTPWDTPVARFLFEKTRLVSAAVSIDPLNPSLRFDVGNYYFGNGAYDLDAALHAYQKALALAPDMPRVHYQTARIYFLKGRFWEAIDEVNKEIFLDPEFKKSYYLKGLIYGYAGNLDKAAENFEKFIAMDSFNWAGYNDLAWVYFKKGDYTNAKKAALAGLEQAPENAWLNNALGLALLNLGEKSAARERFTKALSLLSTMTPADWGKAYPGNNPKIYAQGLKETEESIKYNLGLLGGAVN